MTDRRENETTDTIELCDVLPTSVAAETSSAKDELDRPAEGVAEAQDVSTKQRSNFRTFAIMISLFVSILNCFLHPLMLSRSSLSWLLARSNPSP